MSTFWDDLVGGVETKVESNGANIGSYLGTVLTDALVKVGTPKTGNQSAADIQTQQAQTRVSSMLKLAVPVGLALLAGVLLLKKRR